MSAKSRAPGPRHARGFTLLEVSVVMVVIALILGAVMKGAELVNTANQQTLHAVFVEQWRQSFLLFQSKLNFVPGGKIGDADKRVGSRLGVSELCNTPGRPDLSDEFLSNHIGIPDGEGLGREDEYQYNDGEGLPHRLRACFATVPWVARGTSTTTTEVVSRHVLRLTGVTRDLAELLDAQIDGRINARDGAVRAQSLVAPPTLEFAEWPTPATGNEQTVLILINKE